jgi:hypothetical protein
MAITFLEKRKRSKNLIIVFVALLLITLFVIWWGFFREETLLLLPEEEFVPTFRKPAINFQLLEDPIFEEFEPFEKLPLFEGEIGRENPFIPF